MFCGGNNPILKIIAVENISWESGVFNVAPREYSALAFRIKGKAKITALGKEYFLNSSDILYLPQNLGYTADYSDTELLVIHFLTATDDNEPEVYSFANPEEIYKLFMSLYMQWKRREPGFMVEAMSMLYAILAKIYKKTDKGCASLEFISAVSYINSNFKDSNLDIETVAKKVGINSSVLRQLFKKYYQKSPIGYIIDLRLEYARNLIASGVSVENAALISGFNDSKYFARVVKNRLSCTPRDFKTYGK